MNRKWLALGATMGLAVLVAGGFAMAADEDSPLHKIMEGVQKQNAVILKGTRSATNYAKSQAEVDKAAKELLKLAKEAKPLGKEPAEAAKKTVADWDKLMDPWIQETEKFSKLVSDAKSAQGDAKAAYKKVSTTCTSCHEVFRIDESGF